MKYFFYVVLALSIASIVFNAFKRDIDNLLVGDSQIAVISIVAALCVTVLSCIMLISYRIKDMEQGR